MVDKSDLHNSFIYDSMHVSLNAAFNICRAPSSCVGKRKNERKGGTVKCQKQPKRSRQKTN